MSAPGDVRKAAGTRDDWATPQAIYDKLNAEFRFDVDLAANADNHQHPTRWLEGPCTGGRDCACGTCFPWATSFVAGFINPPYGRGLNRWVVKCAGEARLDMTVVAILPDAMDTAWFREVFASAWEIRIVHGRIQFVGTTSSNPCGSILAVWRPGIRPYGNPCFSLWEQP